VSEGRPVDSRSRQAQIDAREAWLARTHEEAIEPALRLCDPHHHLWDLPGGRYLAEELLADVGQGHRIEQTVFVECRVAYRAGGPPALRPVGETEFVERIAAACTAGGGRPRIAAGIVGFTDLTLGTEAMPVLEAHMAASRRFRGVRHASAWHASDAIHNAHTDPPPGLLGERRFRDGFLCLQRLGLNFDAWVYHTQLDELAALAGAFPDTPIVLNHLGGPLALGPYAGRRDEVFQAWRTAMAGLAHRPNVHVKLGGMTMKASGFGWHRLPAPPSSAELATAMAPYVETCVEYFGAQRCMFESNFPIDRVSCSYTVLWNAFKRLTAPYSAHERAALLHDTAVRVYRLDD